MSVKKENELVTSPPSGTAVALPEAPSFMQGDAQMGLDLVMQKIRPPFAKIVQKQSGDDLIAQFGIGAIILTPDNTLVIAPGGAPVRIVPIFFFSEFLKVSGIELKGQEDFIAARSTDPSSDIARRCGNKDLWYEDHPKYPGSDGHRYRYIESLNFMCLFQEAHLQSSLPFVLPFNKGNYGKGQQLCNQISMRRRPIFGGVFELSIDPVMGENAKGTWRKWLTNSPPERTWIEDEAEYQSYKALHLSLKEAHSRGNIDLNYDDDLQTVDAGPTVAAGTY